MALRRTPTPEPPAPPIQSSSGRLQTLVAAASQVDLKGAGAQSFQIRDMEWQNEAWRHYDICGELRFTANRHAAALSQVRLYVAEVDELGRPAGEAKDPNIQVLAETMFGGPAAKQEALRTIGIQAYVGGESYVVAEGGTKSKGDIWYVVSAKLLKKTAGRIQVKRPMNVGGGWHEIDPNKDLLIRIWTPHPRIHDQADAPTRAVIPILREIERLSQLAFSQIDSRLVSAGLLLLREGIDFPHSDGKPGGAQGLTEMLYEAAQKQLQGAGTAAGLVPIIATVPTGAGDRFSDIANSFAHIKLDSPLQAEISAKLDQAIRRLALGLDTAPEDLLGQGDSNHWAAWQIAESSIQLFIVPTITRVCAGFTESYLAPALKAIGKDPEQYTIWFDPSPLTVRPNRMSDALELYDRGVIGDEALRLAGAFDSADAGPAKAQLRWMAWQLVKADPALVADPALAKILGFPEGITAGGATAPPAAQLPPPPTDATALPEQPDSQTSPAQSGTDVAPPGYAAMLPGAEQAVMRALELAGGRMLDRHMRGQYSTVARYELHTKQRVPTIDRAHELMQGAWAHIPALASHYHVNAGDLERLLSGYCAILLTDGIPHSPQLLEATLRRATAVRRA